jgi:hypothetical protein
MKPEQIAKTSEHSHQAALFAWAAIATKQYPELKWMFAIPNQRHGVIAGARMKAEGVKAGVWDIFLPAPRGNWNGMFIEMKVGSNMLSKEQAIFGQCMSDNDYFICVCYSWEEARYAIQTYLNF